MCSLFTVIFLINSNNDNREGSQIMMDLLNIVLDPYKLKSSCFLCFKSCENMSSLFQEFVVYIECKTFEMRLKDIFSDLFPCHDILCDQACGDCVNLLIKTFILLQKNQMKKSILSNILKKLTSELNNCFILNSLTTVDRLKVNLKLSDYEEITAERQKESTKSTPIELENLNNEATQQEIISELVNCNECTKTFPTQDLLKKHRKIAHSHSNKAFTCEYCGKDCKKYSTLKAHLNSHKNSTCPYCFKVLKSHSYFKLHVKCHETNTRVARLRSKIYYHCDNCPFKSLNKHSLQGHINKTHLQIRPYVCDICDKGFYRKSNLVQHISIHSNSKTMTCGHCGEKFFYKKTLLEHLRLHTGVKPFECEICKQRFVTSGRRTAHFKRKHMEKSIECFLCDKKFSLNSELNTHLKKYHGIMK